MNNINPINLFPNKYRDMILNYKDTLNKLFSSYQVVIFMARKAICFYKSMVISGVIEKPRNCEIYSGRILNYNVKDLLSNKKIVIVDDVMIRGSSVKESLRILNNYGISADVYLMACKEGNDILSEFRIIGSYAELAKEDTLDLSKCIASFIEANMCPYNVDQPIYCISDFDNHTIDNFIQQHNLIDISTSIQNAKGISSYSLIVPVSVYQNNIIKAHVDLCKIRFLCGLYEDKTILLAIPFVLLGEMTTSELDLYYSVYESDNLNGFIYNSNENVHYENKLKVLHYLLAAELMNAFIIHEGINSISRLTSNDNYVFSCDVLTLANVNQQIYYCTDNSFCNDTSYYNEFRMNEYLSITYDFMYSDNMIHKQYYDSLNNQITTELLLLSCLRDYISKTLNTEIDEIVFSNILDILIDKGMIIPSIIHGKDSTIIRTYKCGEIYALNKDHFHLFTYALSMYLYYLNHEKLYKTEFEKLCVLFFREASNRNIFSFGEVSGDEDEYSICYSKFGPRVSTSKPIYNADETSTLASKLLNLNMLELVTVEVGPMTKKDDTVENEITVYDSFKYIQYYKPTLIGEDEIPNKSWVNIANKFARKYRSIYFSLIDEGGSSILSVYKNMYIRNYTELLTMLSIGQSKKNQLLSLLAELYLMDSITTEHVTIVSLLYQCNRIIDGLISGMWKYMCYSQDEHPLDQIINKIETSDSTTNLDIILGDAIDVEPDTDKNTNILSLLHESGKLIYSIVYSIWFMSKKYNVAYRIRGKYLDLTIHRKREFYYKEMKDLRESIEDQVNNSDSTQDINQIVSLKRYAEELITKYKIEISTGKKQTSQSGGNGVNIQNYYGDNCKVVNGDNDTININEDCVTNNFSINDTQIIIDELEGLKANAKDTDKSYISKVQAGIKTNDENKIITFLKKLEPFFKSVSASVLSKLLIAFLNSKGVNI